MSAARTARRTLSAITACADCRRHVRREDCAALDGKGRELCNDCARCIHGPSLSEPCRDCELAEVHEYVAWHAANPTTSYLAE